MDLHQLEKLLQRNVGHRPAVILVCRRPIVDGLYNPALWPDGLLAMSCVKSKGRRCRSILARMRLPVRSHPCARAMRWATTSSRTGASVSKFLATMPSMVERQLSSQKGVRISPGFRRRARAGARPPRHANTAQVHQGQRRRQRDQCAQRILTALAAVTGRREPVRGAGY